MPEAEKKVDPFRCAHIQREVNGNTFMGVVVDIEQGTITKERLYRIQYDDGELEHLTPEQVKEMMIVGDDQEDVPQGEEIEDPIMAKPAARAKAAAKAKVKETRKASAKPKAKAGAKAKAKAKVKAQPKPKAKAKAQAKAKAKAKAKAVIKKSSKPSKR